MRKSWISHTLLLFITLALAACQDDTAEVETEAEQSQPLSLLAERSELIVSPGSLDASGDILYPVVTGDDAAVTSGALRVRLSAQYAEGIEQLFIAVRDGTDGDGSPALFSLCDRDCGAATSVDAWVSGLDLPAAGLPYPAESRLLTVELWVANANDAYEAVDTMPVIWEPNPIDFTLGERIGDTLSLAWQAQPDALRYQLDWTGDTTIDDESFDTTAWLDQLQSISGITETEVTINDLASDEPVYFWLSGINSQGVNSGSMPAVLPALSVNAATINQNIAFGEAPLVLTGTLGLDPFPPYAMDQMRIQLLNDNGDDFVDTIKLVGYENNSGDFGALSINPVDGTWRYELTAEGDLLPDAESRTVSVEGIDVQVMSAVPGLASLATNELTIDTTPPSEDTVDISIDPVGGDGFLNANDVGEDITISGTVTGDVQVGDSIDVTVYGEPFSGEVLADNSFAIDVPFESLELDTEVEVTVFATDEVGNSGEITSTAEYIVDITAPTITFSNLQTNDPSPTLTGTVDEDSTVVVIVGDQTFTATVVAGDWALDLAEEGVFLPDGSYEFEFEATDLAGNVTTATVTLDINSSVPSLTTDTLLVNEDGTMSLMVTGTWDSDADDLGSFDEFTLTIYEPTDPETVRTSYTVVPGEPDFASVIFDDRADVWTFTAGEWPALFSDTLETYPDLVEAELTNIYGTTVSARADAIVKTTPPNDDTVIIEIDPVGGDGYLNAADEGTDITISGVVSGDDGQPGDEVTIEVYTESYTTELNADRGFEMSVPFNVLAVVTELSVTVQATDVVGNSGEITNTAEYTVDTTVPEVTVEDLQTNEPSPMLTGSLDKEGSVEVTLDGSTYDAEVDGNVWTLDLGAESVALSDDIYTIEVKATDLAGNTSTTTGTLDIFTESPQVTVDDRFSIDGFFFLTGTASAGRDDIVRVTVTLEGESGDASLFDPDVWEFDPINQELPGWEDGGDDGTYTITAEAEDQFGNTASATGTLVIDSDYEITAEDNEYTLLANTVLSGVNVLDNDLLYDGDLESSIVVYYGEDAENGVVELDESGNLTYTPDEDFTGIETFTYGIEDLLVLDGLNNTDDATVTIEVRGEPTANDNQFDWIWDEFSPIEVSAAQGVLSNDEDLFDDPIDVVDYELVDGSGTLTVEPDGSFSYSPESGESEFAFTYEISNGVFGDSAVVSIDLRSAFDTPPQICALFPSQIRAHSDFSWDLDPLSALSGETTLSLADPLPSNNLGLSVSGNQATFNNPEPGLYTDIVLEATNERDEVSTLGPFSIEVVPGYSDFGTLSQGGADDFTRELTVSNDAGEVYLFGHDPQASDPELTIIKLDATGVVDTDFATNGRADLSLVAEPDHDAVVKPQFAKPLGDGWLVGGYVRYDDGEESEWLDPFVLRTTADGSLNTSFESGADTPGVWHEADDQVNAEVGAVLINGPDDILVAVNELMLVNNMPVPDGFSMQGMTAEAGPDGEILFDDDQYFPNPRVRVIASTADGSGNLALANELRTNTGNGGINIAIHSAANDWAFDEEPLTQAIAVISTNEERRSTIEHALITDNGFLWVTGLRDTFPDTERDIWTATVNLGLEDEDSPGDDWGNRSQPTAGTDFYPLGLVEGLDDEVILVKGRAAGTSPTVTLDILESAISLVDSESLLQFPSDADYIPTTQAVSGPGQSILFNFLEPAEVEDRQVARHDQIEISDYQPLASDCGVISRYNDQDGGSYPTATDLLVLDDDLLVSVEGLLSWRLDRIDQGNQWVSGSGRSGRSGYFSAFDGPDGDTSTRIEAVAVDSSDRVLLGGRPNTMDPSRVVRLLSDGSLDTEFGEYDGFSEFENGDLVSIAANGEDHTYLARNDGSDSRINKLDDAGTSDESFGDEGELVLADVNIQRLLVGPNDQLYVIKRSSPQVVRLNADGTLDESYGTEENEGWEDLDGDWQIQTGQFDQSGRLLLLATVFEGTSDPVVLAVAPDGEGVDTTFGEGGAALLSPRSSGLTNMAGHLPIMSLDSDDNIYVLLSSSSEVPEVAKLNSDGELDTSWGNLGFAPWTGRAVNEGYDGQGIAVIDGQVHLIWSTASQLAVTRLGPDGFADYSQGDDPTVYFAGGRGDEAVSVTTGRSGRSFLLNEGGPRFDDQQELLATGYFWGLDAQGANLDGFGNNNMDGNLDMGAVELRDEADNTANTAPVGLLINQQGSIFAAGIGFGIPNDWTLFGYRLDTLLDNEQTPEFSELEFLNPRDDAVLESVSPYVNGRAILAGWAEDQGGIQQELQFLDRSGEGLEDNVAINPMPNPEPHRLVQAADLSDGRLLVLVGQLTSDEIWSIGRYIELEGMDTVYGTNFEGWNVDPFSFNQDVLPVDMAATRNGAAMVLTQLPSETHVGRLDPEGQIDTNWGTDGEWSLTGTTPVEGYTLYLDPTGALFVGGNTENDQPVVIRLNAQGEETHRWQGTQLTRSATARVVDFSLDPRGHLNVLMDSYHDGFWQARMQRIPFAAGLGAD